MSILYSTNRDLSSRAIATGVPRNISFPILGLFLKWVDCSGEEWTVDRFKAIKLDAIRVQAGLPPVSAWIAKNKHGRLKGHVGSLLRWMALSEPNFAKGIQLLQVYTSLFSSEVTQKQKDKFLTGVQSPPPTLGVEKAKRILNRGCFLSHLRPVERTLPPAQSLLDMATSPSRRGPTPDGSFPEEKAVIDSSLYLLDTVEGYNHYIKYLDLYGPVLKYVIPYDKLRSFGRAPSKVAGRFEVGRIGLIQEAGYKLRAVANPGRVFQRVLEPLGDSVYSILKNLPWDCTFDQTKAIPHLQQAIADGRTVSCVDLSGATDYFPLSLQEHVLRWLFKESPQVMDLFHDLCTAEWFMPHHGYVSWNRGQPLGLYPSFGSFALTHGLLLLGLCDCEYNHQFFVLGDDVVILDTEVASKYMDILSVLGCPYSDTKTIRSNSLCEFGGKIVTSSKVIPQLKWRLSSDDSFVDIARLLGPRSLRLFRPKQIEVISEISEVPESLGGLGWNSKGKPLLDRILEHPWCLDDEYKPQARMTGLSRERIAKLMQSSLVANGIKCLPSKYQVTYLLPDDDLDQRSLYLTQSHIPRLVPWHMVVGKNLDLVFHFLDQDLDLPIKAELGSSRPTTLDVWLRRLDR